MWSPINPEIRLLNLEGTVWSIKIWKDPSILDATASEVKDGRMAKPFKPGYIWEAKVNGFMSVVKASGARR